MNLRTHSSFQLALLWLKRTSRGGISPCPLSLARAGIPGSSQGYGCIQEARAHLPSHELSLIFREGRHRFLSPDQRRRLIKPFSILSWKMAKMFVLAYASWHPLFWQQKNLCACQCTLFLWLYLHSFCGEFLTFLLSVWLKSLSFKAFVCYLVVREKTALATAGKTCLYFGAALKTTLFQICIKKSRLSFYQQVGPAVV